MSFYFYLLILLCPIFALFADYQNAIPIIVPADHCFEARTIDPSTPRLLILHYTSESLAKTLKIFLGYEEGKKTSSHYAISEDGIVFQHVPENKCAHHAGISYWDKKSGLNAISFGIEHVNLGFKDKRNNVPGIKVIGSSREWYPFYPDQIEAGIQLCDYLIKKYHIEPRNVLAHSDVAPGRKSDPGPLFPWKQLADRGIGAWPDAKKSWQLPCFIHAQSSGNLKIWLIDHLPIWGYQLPDKKTSAKDIIQAFQMHFRQQDISGTADKETATILNNLLCNFVIKSKGTMCPCSNPNFSSRHSFSDGG